MSDEAKVQVALVLGLPCGCEPVVLGWLLPPGNEVQIDLQTNHSELEIYRVDYDETTRYWIHTDRDSSDTYMRIVEEENLGDSYQTDMEYWEGYATCDDGTSVYCPECSASWPMEDVEFRFPEDQDEDEADELPPVDELASLFSDLGFGAPSSPAPIKLDLQQVSSTDNADPGTTHTAHTTSGNVIHVTLEEV